MPQRAKTKKCFTCETLILARFKHCKQCIVKNKAKWENRTLESCQNIPSLKNQHRSSINCKVRARARSLFKTWIDRRICWNCGYNKHVELCHIKPISSFDSSSLISEINCNTNVIILCPNCH